MRTIIFLVAGLVISALATSEAGAAQWLIPGSGCVVDSQTVEAANYQTIGNGVEFKEGFTGTIALTCPVTPGEGDIEGAGFLLDLYVQDPDGAETGSTVLASLSAVNLRTGGATGACSVSSNVDGDPSETGYRIATNPCDHTFDPNTFLYLAKVAIARDGDQPVRFFGLSLVGGP
jgi:hypothetical protein